MIGCANVFRKITRALKLDLRATASWVGVDEAFGRYFEAAHAGASSLPR